MIIKIYKNIHSKYANIFKFFFYIRHLIAIFLLSTSLFLSIPKLFNFEKREQVFKEYLSKYYGVELQSYNTIKYNIFPTPNVSIDKVKLKSNKENLILATQKINLTLNLQKIYSYDDFKAKKVIFYNSKTNIDIDQFKSLIYYFNKIKKNFYIKNLNVQLTRNGNPLIELKKINYVNYGYKKSHTSGEIFNKKFKASFKDKKNLSFKLLETGVEANFLLQNTNLQEPIIGSSNISFLNNILKFDFNLNGGSLKMFNSRLRNQDISFQFDSLISLNPFFVNSDVEINKVNNQFFEKINLEEILEKKDIIKKFNGANKIKYKKNTIFLKNSFTSFSSELKLANGRLTYINKIYLEKDLISCRGESLLTVEFPKANFKCKIFINDKKKFSKKFSLNKEFDKKPVFLFVDGYLNLLKNKIFFENINLNEKNITKKEDLKYYKEVFERVLFDKNFVNIFRFNKIENFIQEII